MLEKKIQYHEATVVEFFLDDGCLKLKLEDVRVDGVPATVTVAFTGASNFRIDEVSSGDIGMFYPDGELLTLNFQQHTATVIIEWHDFKRHISEVKSYEFAYDEVELKPA